MTLPLQDTIVAVATPPGRGGLAVVRLSGPKAFPIALSLLERPVTFTPRRAVLARIAIHSGPIRASNQEIVSSTQEIAQSNQEINQ